VREGRYLATFLTGAIVRQDHNAMRRRLLKEGGMTIAALSAIAAVPAALLTTSDAEPVTVDVAAQAEPASDPVLALYLGKQVAAPFR
jgi:hypothetical protein